MGGEVSEGDEDVLIGKVGGQCDPPVTVVGDLVQDF